MELTTIGDLRDIPASQRSDESIARVDRGTIFGNPFKMYEDVSRDDVCDQYQIYFDDRIKTDAEFVEQVLSLKGKKLYCWCTPNRCHAETIANWLNNQGD